jgi:hypothetical protein
MSDVVMFILFLLFLSIVGFTIYGQALTQRFNRYTMKDWKALNQKHHDHLLAVLEPLLKRLDDAGIIYFLTDGSLLGALREGGIISWDNDIDLAVVVPEGELVKPFMKRLKVAIEQGGEQNHLKMRKPVFQQFGAQVYADNWWEFIDLLVCEIKIHNQGMDKGKRFLRCLDSKIEASQPYDDVFPLTTLPFEHLEVRVPREYKKILYRLYSPHCLESGVITQLLPNPSGGLSLIDCGISQLNGFLPHKISLSLH